MVGASNNPLGASSLNTRRDVLTTRSALREHRRNRGKLEGYRRLCDDFGIDSNALDLEGTPLDQWHWQPRLILTEQPGNWFYPDDLLRFRLLSALREEGGFDPRSGPLFLLNDAFGHRGWKRYFIEFRLGCGLGPVSLVGSPFLRRHQGRSYASLRITGNLHTRMARVLEICDRLLSAAEASPRAFASEASALLDRGVHSGLRSLLPLQRGRGPLEALGRDLGASGPARALAPIRGAREHLVDGMSWAAFWSRVNGDFMGEEIGRLESLIVPFVQAIRDPWRTAEALAAATVLEARQPVPLVGLVTDEDHYRLVFCDRARRRFFLGGTSRPDMPITWDEVCERAAAGHCGGPSVVLKYLLMAARGLYLIADPLDGVTPFEQQISRLHRHYTGLRFPWISLPFHWSREHPGSYLDLYQSDFETHARSATDTFFAS